MCIYRKYRIVHSHACAYAEYLFIYIYIYMHRYACIYIETSVQIVIQICTNKRIYKLVRDIK